MTVARSDDDELLLDDGDEVAAPSTSPAGSAPAASDGSAPPWRVLIVDDDADVLVMTRLALRGLRVDGVAVSTVVASSAAEARDILSAQPGAFALAIVDVVMESEHAGLDFLRWIRANVVDASLRLVLRTGQPGTAPEGGIVGSYDIHDYLAKTDTTARRLVTCVTGAIRACRDIRTIREQRASLEAALGAVGGLFVAGRDVDVIPTEHALVCDVAAQLQGLLAPRTARVTVYEDRAEGRVRLVGDPCLEASGTVDVPPRAARMVDGVLVYGFDVAAPSRFVLAIACPAFHPWDVQLVELFCHAAAMALRNRSLHQERVDWIRTLERFVPRELSAMLSGDLRALVPGDSIVRELTVCFVDVRGFSARTSAIGADAAFRLLNALFARLAEIVARHGGIIDKYLGDGMLVLFPAEPEAALAAATEMQRAVMESPDATEGGPLAIGVGLHAGEVVVGAVGHQDRIDVSVVSSVVNMAARVQDMTRTLECGILLTDDVAARLAPRVRDGLRPMLVHRLRGDDRARVLWEAFGQFDLEEQGARASATSALARATFAAADADWATARSVLHEIPRPDATVTALCGVIAGRV
jgi:class 3 adenylate cyclase/CheY-like chemotaxis protein